MIKNATFTSVWNGDTEITTACKANMDTKEVFDIELAPGLDYDYTLDEEYITIDGQNYEVAFEDDYNCYDEEEREGVFWYRY